MPYKLLRHPDSRSTEVHSITVNAMRAGRPGAMLVSFIVEGAMSRLHIPPVISQTRADGLWQTTCFELFLRPPSGKAYCELNFSPSTQWAAYRFSGYRAGMKPLDGIPDPAIDVSLAERLEVLAVLDLSGAPDLPANKPWRAGISAVIEQANGEKSYWALAHPAGKADFHHADGFVLDLPVPEQT